MASFKQQLSSSLYQSIQCAVQEMLGQVESLVERAVERALLPEDQGTHLDCPGLTSAVSQIDISEAHLRSNKALVAGTSGNTEFSGTGVFQEQDFGCFNVKVENNQQEQDNRQTSSYSDVSNETWRVKYGLTSSRGWKKKDSVQKEELTQSEVTPHCSDVCGTAAVPQVNISQLQLSSNQSLSVDSNETWWVKHGATPSRGWKKKDSDQKEVTQSGESFRVDQGPGLDFPCPFPAAPQVNISQLQLTSNQSLSIDGRQTDPFFDNDDRNETWVKHGATPSRGWKKKDSDQKKVTQSGQRLFCCGFCGKGFRYKSKLIIHGRSHTGEKPYQCDVCEKFFTQRGSLNDHKRIHTGEKPYHCDVCKKSFTHSSDVKKHKRIHTGEKPFSCDVCRKAFSRRYELKRHKCALKAAAMSSAESPAGGATQSSDLRTEETAGEFSCMFCGSQFKHKSSLQIHLKHLQGPKPLICDVCGQVFCQKPLLVQHQRMHCRRPTELTSSQSAI